MATRQPSLLGVLRRLAALGAVLMAAAVMLAAVLMLSDSARASSHREAPLISKDAFADNTDTYVFIPPGQTENIVLAASWIPFEAPEGGPNYFEWDDEVRYDIHVDVNGDATSDVTYTLSTQTSILNANTFLYNTGPIEMLNDPDQNRQQYYTITEVFRPGLEPMGSPNVNVLVSNAPAPPVNIGSKSTPDYQSLVNDAIQYVTTPNGDQLTIFAGQTDDAFWVDLQVFDLLTLRGQNPPVGYSTGNNIPVDSLAGFNVHSLVLEVPIDRLVRNNEPVLGVWATARRQSMGVFTSPSGPIQVSRLGNPLVNEAVIPMAFKDFFNAIEPSVDLTAYTLLQKSVEDPELGQLLCALYGVPLPGDADDNCTTEYTAGVPRSERGDIFDIFLTGMVLENDFVINTATGTMMLPAGFNINRPQTVVPAEMLRINTAISDTLCAPTPSRLGILGGDACGFPNGRRLTDDVVEIELLAVAGAAYEVLDDRDATFQFDSALINVLDDGLDANDKPFSNTFPYLATAHSGQERLHANPITGLFLPLIMVGTIVFALPMAALAYVRRKENQR